MKCSPSELLPLDTEVCVNGQYGKVVKAEWGKDQNGGMICVHTIRLTHKHVNRGAGTSNRIPLKTPREAVVNYSFIGVMQYAR